MNIIYNVDDKPSAKESVIYACQHVLAMLAGNMTVPLLIVTTLGLSVKEGTILMQCALLMAGIATLIQVIGFGKIGSRLPIVMGTSNAFLAATKTISVSYGLAACFGASLVGSLFEIVLGSFLDRARKIFTPLVTGIVVMTIGMTLIPTGVRAAAGSSTPEGIGDPVNLMLAGIVMLTIVLCNGSRFKMLKSASLIIGIMAGCVVAGILGRMDLHAAGQQALVSIPRPFAFGMEFQWPAIVVMLFMYFATTVETVGDTAALTAMARGTQPTEAESKGAVLADGIGSFLAACFNAFPNTSYTQNIGVVSLTGVFSRSVVTIGAVLLLLLSLFPSVAGLLLCIPQPVLGGATLVTFLMVFTSGLGILRDVALSQRNILIIAISLSIGVGFALVPEAASHFPASVSVCLTNGIVPAGVTAIALDRLMRDTESKS